MVRRATKASGDDASQPGTDAITDPDKVAPADTTPGAAGVPSAAADATPSDLVPAWLAVLVLVLLLGVASIAGYLIRGLFIDEPPSAPARAAVAEWTEQVEKDPNDPESLLGLAFAKQQEGDLEGALAGYDHVLEVDPGNQGALFNKGSVLLALGRGKDAEVVLWDVLEVAPDHVLAAKALGEYYIGKKQYKSALTALEPVAKARPEFADVQFLSGYACEQLGIREVAIAYYRGALKYVPDHADAREGLKRLGAAE